MQNAEGGKYRAFGTELAKIVTDVVSSKRTKLRIEIKQDGSVLTNIDIAVEQAVRARIESEFPEHGVLGEELPARNPAAEYMWVIDPIDGTAQFAAGLPNYGSLIALCRHGLPILGIISQPDTRDIYLGVSGLGAWHNEEPVRTSSVETLAESVLCISDPDSFDHATRPGMERLRSASLWNVFEGGCLSFGLLAAGRIDASVCGSNLTNFDICALVPVVEGAGGTITSWRGEALKIDSSGEVIACANRKLHAEAIDLLNR